MCKWIFREKHYSLHVIFTHFQAGFKVTMSSCAETKFGSLHPLLISNVELQFEWRFKSLPKLRKSVVSNLILLMEAPQHVLVFAINLYNKTNTSFNTHLWLLTSTGKLQCTHLYAMHVFLVLLCKVVTVMKLLSFERVQDCLHPWDALFALANGWWYHVLGILSVVLFADGGQ